MLKKCFITFLLIILLIFTFTLTSYARYECSYYNEKNKLYYIGLDFKEFLGLDVKKFISSSTVSSSTSYVVVFENKNNSKYPYSILYSDAPFTAYSITDDTFSYAIRPTTDVINAESYNGTSWGNSTSVYNRKFNLDDIIFSSDNIMCDDKVLFYGYGEEAIPTLVSSISSIDTLDTVIGEIISILPVILVVLSSYISIRKGISFIINKIRKS